jgi:hypothetical protein
MGSDSGANLKEKFPKVGFCSKRRPLAAWDHMGREIESGQAISFFIKRPGKLEPAWLGLALKKKD